MYIWKKKTFVTYVLSIMVLLIHVSTLSNYSVAENDTVYEFTYQFINNWLCKGITSCAVPLFMIISGALFFRDYCSGKYWGKLKARIPTLLVPYLLWNTIWMLFEIMMSYTGLSALYVGRTRFVISFDSVLEGIFHYGCNLPFWFVFELMFFVLFSPIIHLIVKNKVLGIILIIIIAGAKEFGVELPFPLFYSGSALIYYLVGAYVGTHYYEKFSKPTSCMKQRLSVIIMICCMCLFSLSYVYGWDLGRYGIRQIIGLVYCYSVWNVADIIMLRMGKKDDGICSTSFAVFAMHTNVSAVITKVIYLVLPSTPLMGILNFAATIILTLLSIYGFCLLMKKLLPGVYAALMGGRIAK